MKIRHWLFVLSLVSTVGIVGCYTVPETGRTSINFMPESFLSEQAAMAFAQMRQETKVSASPRHNRRVSGICERVITAAAQTATLPPLSAWEFVVFDDDAVINAFAMPGGKLGFYTGILRVTETDDELAAIVAHEVAHVAARHGNERMSQAMLLATGGLAVGYAVRDEDESTQEAIMLAYGIGSMIGASLPYSRLHEYEADEMGLIYMARAGYDPRAAIRFWQKMESLPGGATPEFLSTHPSHGNRIQRLQKHMPRALEEYERARQGR